MADVGRWWLTIAAAGALVVAVELLIAAALVIAIRNRLARLTGLLGSEAGMAESELMRLQLALADGRRLLLPYRRLWKSLRHPLVVALLASFWRRRSRTA